jgi:hypothetical protein
VRVLSALAAIAFGAVAGSASAASVDFGLETAAGFGGSDLGSGSTVTALTLSASTCTGWNAADFVIDGNGLVVPSRYDHTYAAASGSPLHSADYGKQSSLNAHVTGAPCSYTFSGTAGGNPVSGTINISATGSYVRGMTGTTADADASSLLNQLSMILANGSTTTSHQALKLGDTVYGRTSTWNTTNNFWQFSPPAGLWSGSGRITITSEVPDASSDANGNPVGGGGFQLGPTKCSGFSSGDNPVPVDFNAVTLYSNYAGAMTAASMFAFTNNCNGITFNNMHVETGPAVTNPNKVGGIVFAYGGATSNLTLDVRNSHFIQVSPALSSESTTHGTVPVCATFISNIIEMPNGDGIDVQGPCPDIESNFIFDPVICCGEHPDAIQILPTSFGGGPYTGMKIIRNIAVRANPAAASGINTVTITSGGSGATGANCFGTTYQACLVEPIGGSGSMAAINLTISGGAVTAVGTITGPSGTQGGVNYVVGDTITGFTGSCCGSLTGFSATVNSPLQGRQDFQCIFMNSSGGTDSISSAQIENNLCIITYNNGISLGGRGATYGTVDAPTFRYNTVLKDFQVNAGAAGSSGAVALPDINVYGGTDANLDRNLGTSIGGFILGTGGTAQAGTVTCYPGTTSSNAATSCQPGGTAFTLSLANYQAHLPSYNTLTTNQNTRAANITMTTPSAGGSAVNADGTYNGWLFPANDYGEVCFNDGSVWDHTVHCTPAT